jgi:hypothetical protein
MVDGWKLSHSIAALHWTIKQDQGNVIELFQKNFKIVQYSTVEIDFTDVLFLRKMLTVQQCSESKRKKVLKESFEVRTITFCRICLLKKMQ